MKMHALAEKEASSAMEGKTGTTQPDKQQVHPCTAQLEGSTGCEEHSYKGRQERTGCLQRNLGS